MLHRDNLDKPSDLRLSTEEGLAPILALAVAVALGLIIFHLHPNTTMTPTAKNGHWSHASFVDKAESSDALLASVWTARLKEF